MWVCQEKCQRAYPACGIKCAVEILSEVGDQPGTSMLRAEHCRGPMYQARVLAGSVTQQGLCGTAGTVWVQLGYPQPSQVSALLLLTRGKNCSSHCWQQHACPHEDAAGWPVLSSGLCPPEKSLDNLISGCPWLLVAAKAHPVVSVLHILQPYLKVSVDLHLYIAWTTKVLVFQFQSCKC